MSFLSACLQEAELETSTGTYFCGRRTSVASKRACANAHQVVRRSRASHSHWSGTPEISTGPSRCTDDFHTNCIRPPPTQAADIFPTHYKAWASFTASVTQNTTTSNRISALTDGSFARSAPFVQRREVQAQALKLPVLPTTTIGSFPQVILPWSSKIRLDYCVRLGTLSGQSETAMRWKPHLSSQEN